MFDTIAESEYLWNIRMVLGHLWTKIEISLWFIELNRFVIQLRSLLMYDTIAESEYLQNYGQFKWKSVPSLQKSVPSETVRYWPLSAQFQLLRMTEWSTYSKTSMPDPMKAIFLPFGNFLAVELATTMEIAKRKNMVFGTFVDQNWIFNVIYWVK